MEKRTLEISLTTAKGWYKGNDKSLKELALQVYSKDELNQESWKDIRTFDDALEIHGYNKEDFNKLCDLLRNVSPASAAAFKVNLIRKALNKDYNLSLTKDRIWYPYIPFITEDSTWYKNDLELGNKYIIGIIKYNNTIYKVIGGFADLASAAGLGDFRSDDGVGLADAVGCLGCAKKEIAEHFGKYFWKEIYQMMYADMIPDIEYIDLVDRDYE